MPTDFVDMPFDETLFESNELMRTYWERSTENRSFEASDSNVEEREQMVPYEFEELRELTKKSFEATMAQKQVVEQVIDVPSEPSVLDAVVVPLAVTRSVSSTNLSGGAQLLIAILAIVALWIIIVWLGQSKRKSRF
jgi:hypothetical protein